MSNRIKKKYMAGKTYFDYPTLFLVIFLICFGMVMIYSTSSYKSMMTYGNSYKWVFKQGLVVLGGAIALSLSIYIPYNFRITFSIYLPSLSENIYLLHSDVTSIPHIFITHSYYRIKLILTTVSQDNLSISKRRKVILICIINLCYINVNPV